MKQDRLTQMERYICQQGSCSIDALCETFGVSKITVRRDVAALADRGVVTKVYGGVSYNRNAPIAPLPLIDGSDLAAKQRAAILAARLVEDGDTLFLDAGSTICLMVPQLVQRKNLTVITNSLRVLQASLGNPDMNVIAFGGKLQHSTGSIAGNAQDTFFCRRAFISSESVSTEHGVGNTNFYDGVTKRLAIDNSDLAYLVLDSTKFTSKAYNIFAKLKDFSGLICDSRPPQTILDYCAQNGIAVSYE